MSNGTGCGAGLGGALRIRGRVVMALALGVLVLGMVNGAIAANSATNIDLAVNLSGNHRDPADINQSANWFYRIADSLTGGTGPVLFTGSANDAQYHIVGNSSGGAGGTVVVEGTQNSNARGRIVIHGDAKVQFNPLTISNLGSDSRVAVTIMSGAGVELTLNGTANITGTHAGIEIQTGATLTIKGKGHLRTNALKNAGTLVIDSDEVIVETTSSMTTVTGATLTHNEGLFINGTAFILKDTKLPNNLTIPSSRTLSVGDGVVLTIPNNITLTNSGILETAAGSGGSVGGLIRLENGAKMVSTGTFRNNGQIDNQAGGSITGTINPFGDVLRQTQSATTVTGLPAANTIQFRQDTTLTLGISGGGTGAVTCALDVTSLPAADHAGTLGTGNNTCVVTIKKVGEVHVNVTKAGNNDFLDATTLVKITVGPRTLTANDITVGGTYTYTSDIDKAPCPALSNITVRVGSGTGTGTVTLTRGTHYEVSSCGNNTKASTVASNDTPGDSAYIVINAVGTTYTGTVNKPFYVAPLNVSSSAAITLNETASEYDGSRKTITAVVTIGTWEATSSDYDIVYRKNNADLPVEAVDTALTNFGTITVRAAFKGNYTGTRDATYTISRKSIKVDNDNSFFPNKVYNGNVAVDTAAMDVKFEGAIEQLQNVVDYVITNATYGSAGAGDKTPTATVSLVSTGPRARNYTLSSGALRGEATIDRAEPDTSHFTFTIPTDHKYAGVPRGIARPTLKSGFSGMGSFKVLYNGDTIAPTEIGTYTVALDIQEGTNYNASTLTLGEYSIGEPLKPEITTEPADFVARMEDTTGSFRVVARSPNSGTLSYQWFTAEGDTVSGARSASFRPDIDRLGEGSYTYYVVVTNRKSVGTTGAEVAYETSSGATVTVLLPATPITGATVIVKGTYVYTGSPIVLHRDSVTVTMINGEELLGDGVDYRLTYANNVDAGTATLTVTGVDEYKGSISRTFTIGKSALGIQDIASPSALSTVYSGEPQPIELALTGARTGLGKVTISYNGATVEPVHVGTYEVKLISIAEGTNFTAFTPEEPISLGTYAITKKTPVIDDVIFTIENRPVTGEPQGIGSVTLKGTGYGDVTVRYNNLEDVPSEIGVYVVSVVIEGGVNYEPATLTLGTYEIYDPTSVASNERVVTVADGEGVGVVAPVQMLDTKITAGPNPVGGMGGAVSFYRAGAPVTGGTLTVYNAAGDVVRKIAVSEEGAVAAGDGGRAIGSWDLRDVSGRAVSAGTYLVRGSVKTVGGRVEKVSFLIGVTR